jgi:hypothetical protein
MFQGYLRKGTNRPALTGRAARRADQRATDRAFAVEHGMRVIGHHERARAAASRGGFLFAGDYLRTLGLPDADRYSSAFGTAVAQAYRTNHGVGPDRRGLTIVNGRLRPTFRYHNPLDLVAGALAYKRTAELVLTLPGHPVAREFAGI